MHASKAEENSNIKMTFIVLKVILAHRSYYKPEQADVLSHSLGKLTFDQLYCALTQLGHRNIWQILFM